jgi:L-malate glycosyltransferase
MTHAPTGQPRNIFLLHPSDFLTDHEPHGDGLIAFGFIRELARRGYRLHVAARKYSLRTPLPPNVIFHKLPIRIRMPLLDRLEFMIRVRALFKRLQREESIQLIHQMNPVFTGLSLALTGTGTPLVLGTIVPRWPNDPDSLASRHPLLRRLLRTIKNLIVSLQQKQASALLLTSPAAMNRIPRPSQVQHKVMFVPHGIDTDLFSPARAGKSSEQPLTILFLANLQKRKGIFVLLEAFAEVVKTLPNCRLRIVGAGPEATAVAEHVSTLTCSSQIELVGNVSREQVGGFFQECSVYCLPSFGEPYGASVVEAMSCGAPVVVTAAGGFPYLVPDGGGRFVPPGDASALASALIEILKDEKLQRSMGLVNREYAVASLGWNTAVDRLELAYRTVFSRQNLARPASQEALLAEPSTNELRQ